MPLYWWFIIAAIIVALNAEKIGRAVNANVKIKRYMVVLFVFMIAAITILIKNAL